MSGDGKMWKNRSRWERGPDSSEWAGIDNLKELRKMDWKAIKLSIIVVGGFLFLSLVLFKNTIPHLRAKYDHDPSKPTAGLAKPKLSETEIKALQDQALEDAYEREKLLFWVRSKSTEFSPDTRGKLPLCVRGSRKSVVISVDLKKNTKISGHLIKGHSSLFETYAPMFLEFSEDGIKWTPQVSAGVLSNVVIGGDEYYTKPIFARYIRLHITTPSDVDDVEFTITSVKFRTIKSKTARVINERSFFYLPDDL